ncbi:MAG: response regulator [Myxococcota bacterium]
MADDTSHIDLVDKQETPSVLVVDDEKVICEILRDFLEYEGFRVTAVNSGEAAVEELNKTIFDVILTDLKMPGIGGLDLLHRIADSGCDTAMVIMTGYGTVETAIEAMKKGAFDYILKPFKPGEVVQVLRRALDKLGLQRENFALRESVGFYELSEALSSAMPLDAQLEKLVGLVADNFGAQAVEIFIQDPKNPGAFRIPASVGPARFNPRLDRLISRFGEGRRVLCRNDKLEEWLENPSRSDHSVHSFMAAPLRIRGLPFGVLNAYSLRKNHFFTEGQRKGLSIFAARAASAIDTARMYGNLKETFTQTMESFARALEAKDNYTHGHSDRVAMYSRWIAETVGLPEAECECIEQGGLMHDIGKIGIRSADLNKPQKLTEEEYKMFQSHPVVGRRIIEPIAFLANLIPCVYHHHESYDGKGYPEGLGGKDIPREARILTVADSYDAMTSDRPYRKALPHDVAIAEFKRCAGKQFDPEAVEAFLECIGPKRRERRAKNLPVPD